MISVSLTVSFCRVSVLNNSDPAGIPDAEEGWQHYNKRVQDWRFDSLIRYSTLKPCAALCHFNFPAKLLASDKDQSTTSVVEENLEAEPGFGCEFWPNFLRLFIGHGLCTRLGESTDVKQNYTKYIQIYKSMQKC